MTWYASRRDHFVMIILNEGEKVVVTPDDLSFEGEVLKYIHPQTHSKI